MPSLAVTKLSPDSRQAYDQMMVMLRHSQLDPDLIEVIDAAFDAFYMEGMLRAYTEAQQTVELGVAAALAKLK